LSDKVESAQRFYDRLGPLFDVMTDWEARLKQEGPFLKSHLESIGAKRVLDAACGTGGHSKALAGWGYDVVGADVSPRMIELASAHPGIPFVVTDLAALPTHFPAGSFDAVLCLGNSLPHLLSDTELAGGIAGMAAVLRPGGMLITQNLNYDLRWRTQPRFFAAQGGEFDKSEVLVWRFADYDLRAHRVLFHIAYFRKNTVGWQVHVTTTLQRPLFAKDTLAALAAAGLAQVSVYGQMAVPEVPFDEGSSADCVVVARKG
jgi:glycine/sarcosine N-methyltransferase